MSALAIAIILLGGAIAWLLGANYPKACRWAAVSGIGLAALVWLATALGVGQSDGPWHGVVNVPWIPALGIRLHLGVDALSGWLVGLTHLLGLGAIAAAWTEIEARPGFFHFNLMATLAGIVGVFTALDLFAFYFFWELMLVPMYLLIAVWGHANRLRAAIKFFVFTQASGLLMLLAIVALALAYNQQTGSWSFSYPALLGLPLASEHAFWLMLGFFIAFAVKLPAVGVHTWLPDAHTEAPTAGSVILAGLLLKTGAYGLLRFGVPLFPQAAAAFAPVAGWLGVVGVLYGAVQAFGQTDLKRLVAYTSVAHMGFVLLGIAAWRPTALDGVVAQIVAHGLSTGGLFVLVGIVQQRTGTRDINSLGGLWSAAPRMGAVGMVLAMAALGLPGLGNFVGEFLILAGAFAPLTAATVVATAGLVLATVYALWLVQSVFHGDTRPKKHLLDLGLRELATLGVSIAALLWLGVHPNPMLRSLDWPRKLNAGSVSSRDAAHAAHAAGTLGCEEAQAP